MTSQRASELRSAFDRAFTEVPHASNTEVLDLLGISIYGNPYALRLEEIAGLYANKKITRIPVQATGLLGIAGFRGAILPVYDLGALIGLPRAEKPAWLAIVAKTDVAFAFESFDGHLRVAKDTLAPNDSKEGGRQHLSHLLPSSGALRGVIDIASALRPIVA
jgi:purine-binding chemotaxis protein CheW